MALLRRINSQKTFVTFYLQRPEVGDEFYHSGLGLVRITAFGPKPEGLGRNKARQKFQRTITFIALTPTEKGIEHTIVYEHLKSYHCQSRYEGLALFRANEKLYDENSSFVRFYGKSQALEMKTILETLPNLGGKKCFTLHKIKSGRMSNGKDIWPYWGIKFEVDVFQKMFPGKSIPSVDMLRGICYGYLLLHPHPTFHY